MNSSCHKAAHLQHSPQQHDEVSVTGEASQSIDSFTANELHFLPVNTHTVCGYTTVRIRGLRVCSCWLMMMGLEMTGVTRVQAEKRGKAIKGRTVNLYIYSGTEDRHTWVNDFSQVRVAFPAKSLRCLVAVETPLSCHCKLEEKDEKTQMRLFVEWTLTSTKGVLGNVPTGTTSWYWLLLEPLKVLEGRGMTGVLLWRESSTTCDKSMHYSLGRIPVLLPVLRMQTFTWVFKCFQISRRRFMFLVYILKLCLWRESW